MSTLLLIGHPHEMWSTFPLIFNFILNFILEKKDIYCIFWPNPAQHIICDIYIKNKSHHKGNLIAVLEHFVVDIVA